MKYENIYILTPTYSGFGIKPTNLGMETETTKNSLTNELIEFLGTEYRDNNIRIKVSIEVIR